MRAAVYEEFKTPLAVQNVPDPIPDEHGVVIKVKATGLCRSDWHGWMGHDPLISLPHVPGHELAGEIAAIGSRVSRWKIGDRVTLPFVCGCGTCPQCISGNHQVCDNQTQPGFTHWGSFAEYVSVQHADINLVRLPDELTYVAAASLGCRIATSFRAIVDQGQVTGGQWVSVHGCGGVGLSAIMIAQAIGASVIAIDIADSLGVNANPFLMCVAVAASCAFLTPIGHKNNTLIMGPGGYRFGDYWRMGLPLEILTIGVGVPAILWFWPL